MGTGQTHLLIFLLSELLHPVNELQYMAHLVVTNSFSLSNKVHSKRSRDHTMCQLVTYRMLQDVNIL